MKKIIMTVMFFMTLTHALTSDVYCMPLGDDMLWCSDSNGNEWTVFIGD